jgi:protein subunit release factor B
VSERELLFSVTKKDLDITFFRGSGNGGQNRNKRDTACRIVHRASGAVATAQEHRTQLQNKRAAFLRLVETDRFKTWVRIQTGRATVKLSEMEAAVDEMMSPDNLLVEVWDGNAWVMEET